MMQNITDGSSNTLLANAIHNCRSGTWVECNPVGTGAQGYTVTARHPEYADPPDCVGQDTGCMMGASWDRVAICVADPQHIYQ